MKVSFIGFGNMGQAMAAGLLEKNVTAPGDIFASARNQEKLKAACTALGIAAADSNTACAAAGDVVILAVKPYQIGQVVEEIKEVLPGKLVVCIAAGFTGQKLRPLLPETAHSVCVMPNTPIRIGQGILVWDEDNDLSDDDKARLVNLFAPVALIAPVDADHMNIAGTIAGCTPAYAAMFMEALADAGVKHGLTRPLALEMSAKVLAGTGLLCLATGDHPGQMKDAVCSPGGTTIKGVASLEKDGFRGDVISAIDAVMGADR